MWVCIVSIVFGAVKGNQFLYKKDFAGLGFFVFFFFFNIPVYIFNTKPLIFRLKKNLKRPEFLPLTSEQKKILAVLIKYCCGFNLLFPMSSAVKMLSDKLLAGSVLVVELNLKLQ